MYTPRDVRIPPWLASVFGATVGAGALFGAIDKAGGPADRVLRSTFFASAFAYLGISLLDFWEHRRLEQKKTGKYLAAKAVPLGESINHVLEVGTVIAALLTKSRALAIAALPIYLAFGWRDELLYHRKRCKHREDMMHTMAHLAAAAMLGAHYGSRFQRPAGAAGD